MRHRLPLAALALVAAACTDPLSPDTLEGRWGLAHVDGAPLPFQPPPDVALGWALLGDTLIFAPGGAGGRVMTVQETVAGVVRVRVDSSTFFWRIEGRDVVVRPDPCPVGRLCAAVAAPTLRFTRIGEYLAYFEDGVGPFAYESTGFAVVPLAR